MDTVCSLRKHQSEDSMLRSHSVLQAADSCSEFIVILKNNHGEILDPYSKKKGLFSLHVQDNAS